MSNLSNLKVLVKNNKSVIENYFFMTALQILNSMFYLFIYPFLIRVLGADSYGLYVFASSFAAYFISFVGFGFDMPAVKLIAQQRDNKELMSHTVSCVFTAKIYLEIISLLVFSIAILSIPFLRNNWVLFVICFSQTITSIIFPQWFFQGIQKMNIVTYIQLLLKLISLPFIFIVIKSDKDLSLFACIASFTSVGGGLIAAIILQYYQKIQINWISFKNLKKWYRDAFPFFLSGSAGIIKEQSVSIIIGAYFGMKEVALYDLANKIIVVPRTLLLSVNGALFPKIIINSTTDIVKKIIRYETIIGVSIIIAVMLFGKWMILLLGGIAMAESYPIAVVLSITILTWIVVGSYISFIFVPQDKYYYVSVNQLVALFSFFIYCGVGLLFAKNIFMLALALSLAGLTEIAYCKYIIQRENLL